MTSVDDNGTIHARMTTEIREVVKNMSTHTWQNWTTGFMWSGPLWVPIF